MATHRTAVLQRLSLLNTELDALFSSLDNYDEAQLNASPAPGAWSALQTLHHLILSEKLALAYCRKKLSFEPELSAAGISTRLRSFLVKHYDSVPFKAKAPKIVSTEKLPAQSSLDAVKQQWRAVRMEISEFLEAQPDTHYQQEVFKHPFAGRLDFAGMVDFFQGHFRRHRKQALQALSQA